MKVALYARVSMDEAFNDNRYQEPENQLQPLRDWVKSRGDEVYAEYIDRASGADPSRPRFRQMFLDAHQRKFNAIVVWKMDRFSRESMSMVLSRVQDLRRYGVGIMSMTESWLDTSKDSPVAELLIGFMSWAAAEERRKIGERTQAGIARLKAIGQYKGGRPRKCPKCRLNVDAVGPPSKRCQCNKGGEGGTKAELRPG